MEEITPLHCSHWLLGVSDSMCMYIVVRSVKKKVLYAKIIAWKIVSTTHRYFHWQPELGLGRLC